MEYIKYALLTIIFIIFIILLINIKKMSKSKDELNKKIEKLNQNLEDLNNKKEYIDGVKKKLYIFKLVASITFLSSILKSKSKKDALFKSINKAPNIIKTFIK